MEELAAALLLLARTIVGGTLLIAGLGKIRGGHANFLRSVYAYDLLPSGIARPVSWALPWCEVLVGVMLISGLLVRGAAVAAIALLATFSFAISLSLLRGLQHPCGCTTDLTPVKWRLVGRNAVLAVLASAVLQWGAGAFAVAKLAAPEAGSLLVSIGMTGDSHLLLTGSTGTSSLRPGRSGTTRSPAATRLRAATASTPHKEVSHV